MNKSYAFAATHEGYMKAYARIQAIIDQGHKVGGDVAKVYDYVR